MITSCANTWDSVKRGLTGKKQTSTDEFLVEKKDPLVLPPNFEDLPIPQKRLDNVDLNYILSNSFGFGGTNASLVFKNPKA